MSTPTVPGTTRAASTSLGHGLRFGVEILGGVHEPSEIVALALRAEDLGAEELVLPDGAAAVDVSGAALDGLTVAAWTAARTATSRVATRLDPVSRPASTVARAGASLQLLADGRASLVIDVAADTEALLAAEEMVAVIRALLGTAGVRTNHPGTRHRLVGAEAGPALDQDLPLWLAGSDKAVATLAGRVADGIVIDLDVVGAEGVADLIVHLERATAAAGRDVRELRRAVVWSRTPVDVDALTALVVDHRVSSLVLRARPEDARRLEAFIGEVAPAVRSSVERALGAGALTSRPVRRADVRARRRPGIAYDAVPAPLAGTAVEPGDPAFGKVRSTYLRGGDPGLVLRPQKAQEVAEALAFARDHRHLALGLRSGGHGISGRSTNDGGLVIDLGGLDDISVLDRASRLVRIEPGARWRDVATVLRPHGWALSSGDYGGVGVGGLATAGGIGFLSRKHGLTIDHLRAVEMVLADGTLVRASRTENPELFWAARGAGANFGVAVAFEFVVDEVDEVGWAQLAFQVPDLAAYLEAFGQVAAETPRETTPFLILGQGSAQLMAMVDSSDPDVIVRQLQPFAEIAPMVQQQVVVAPYAAVMNMFPDHPHNGRGEPHSRSAFAREITPDFAAASAELIRTGAAHWYQIRTVGGAVADVPADATAYAHRDANFALAVMGGNAQLLDRRFDPVREHADGLYLSFESDPRPERVADAFPPATLARLRRLKADLDPHNLFRDNFNVVPAPANDAATRRSAS